jgi:hypothetical protein
MASESDLFSSGSTVTDFYPEDKPKYDKLYCELFYGAVNSYIV